MIKTSSALVEDKRSGASNGRTDVKRNVKTVQVQKQDTTGRLPHTSFYCTPAVLKALKEIAVARDMKVHDLLIEGVRTVMEKAGISTC